MARAYQVVSVLFLLLGLFVLYQSMQLRYATGLGPGPGFFGVWLGGLMVVLAVVFFVQNTLPRSRPDEPIDLLPSALGKFRLAVTVGLLVLTVVILPVLGFRLTIFGLALILLTVVGRLPWWEAILVALVAGFGTFYVFSLLGVFLPKGVLGGI